MLPQLLKFAGKVSIPSDDNDKRNFWLGAVAIRRDGCIVKAKNGAVMANSMSNNSTAFPPAHAEARCLKKAGRGAILFVARVNRKTKQLAMARPCHHCVKILYSYEVERCYFSISPNEYGVWTPESERIKLYDDNFTVE